MGVVDRADRRLLRGVSSRTLSLLLGEPEPVRPVSVVQEEPAITLAALTGAARNQLGRRASELKGSGPPDLTPPGRGRRHRG